MGVGWGWEGAQLRKGISLQRKRIPTSRNGNSLLDRELLLQERGSLLQERYSLSTKTGHLSARGISLVCRKGYLSTKIGHLSAQGISPVRRTGYLSTSIGHLSDQGISEAPARRKVTTPPTQEREIRLWASLLQEEVYLL